VAVRSLATASPAETEAIGAQLASDLRPGSVVLVRGEVGAGKTTFVRGAARALGVEGPVTSPTFTIANRYRAGERSVSHLDLYRLSGLEHEDPALLEDYLGGEQIVFIEWPEHGASELVRADVQVDLSHRGGDQREVAIEDQPPPTARAGEPRA
jgi:tRNA threonylcarbamoyladenosine biosynthesis protein TsaE